MSQKRFSTDELYTNLLNLKKNEVMKYPANGYNTLNTAKRALQHVTNRGYKDEAISKTHRKITRLK